MRNTRKEQITLRPYERTSSSTNAMSEKCQVRTSAAASFDDFVGACHQCRRSDPHCHSRQDDRYSDEVALQPVIDCEKHRVGQPVLRRKVRKLDCLLWWTAPGQSRAEQAAREVGGPPWSPPQIARRLVLGRWRGAATQSAIRFLIAHRSRRCS